MTGILQGLQKAKQFGLRWQAQRDTAMPLHQDPPSQTPNHRTSNLLTDYLLTITPQLPLLHSRPDFAATLSLIKLFPLMLNTSTFGYGWKGFTGRSKRPCRNHCAHQP
jgi:hypothetical protein